MSLRTARVAAPVLDRIRIVSLTGYVEEVDLRPVGARMVIAVASADGMPAEKVPRRVRVTTRKTPDGGAGDFVALKARLLPPSHASLPGGYDFARDAFFAGVGAVGSTLGPIEVLPPPGDATLRQRFSAAIDHARNRLALRVNAIIGGDEGAIAAAMVTGKRDFLSQRRQGSHPRGRHLPHHHHLRRADDAGRRDFLRRHAAACWRCRRRWR